MNRPSYHTYKGLPPVAGLCSLDEAMKRGLPVEECVGRLKRYHYAFRRLHEIFTARITAEPIYELKMGFSLHAHLCAEHASALRKRISEMREPPLGLDAVPDPGLEIFFDEIRGAPTTEELVLGLYEKAVPALQAALQRHLDDTNPLVDHPSVRICQFALPELGDIAGFGWKTCQCLVDANTRGRVADWLALLDQCLVAAGELEGSQPPVPHTLARIHSAKPHVYDGVPKRDDRFPDPYNFGVNPEAFLYDPQYPANAKTLMLLYKRIREIDVPEMMASILTETKGKPWEYYRDMTRQLWDEARHGMMGEVGFLHLGVDWRKAMINFCWSLGLNTKLTPLERHAVLYYIEQGLMPKTGKRFEWEVAVASQNPLAALFQDYDWADEVLHAQIGRTWLVSEFKSAPEALKYGETNWPKAYLDVEALKEQGLTQHRNWWPDVYRDACRAWNIAPDPKVIAFAQSYATAKQVSG